MLKNFFAATKPRAMSSTNLSEENTSLKQTKVDAQPSISTDEVISRVEDSSLAEYVEEIFNSPCVSALEIGSTSALQFETPIQAALPQLDATQTEHLNDTVESPSDDPKPQHLELRAPETVTDAGNDKSNTTEFMRSDPSSNVAMNVDAVIADEVVPENSISASKEFTFDKNEMDMAVDDQQKPSMVSQPSPSFPQSPPQETRCRDDIDLDDRQDPVAKATYSGRPPTSTSLTLDLDSLPSRARSVPPICGNHYTFMANWPPQDPPKCDLGRRTDVFPPKNAPLHIWIQAYALRWGVWAASIPDPPRREQVLNAVTDKMKQAWETAIMEGYFARPSQLTVDMTYVRTEGDGHDGQNKRSRKRAQSPSKSPAGFAHEGNDKLAVTNGELAEQGIMMEQILRRVEDRNYDEGEKRLDDVLSALPDGREEILVRDWSTSSVPIVRGRNLLMYCLYVVQHTRADIDRMQRLMKHFTRDQQRKNTQNRIDLYQEREAQHLALAAELSLREPEPTDFGGDDIVELDTTPIDLISDAESSAGEVRNELDTDTPEASGSKVIEITKDVLTAKTEEALLSVFTSRELQVEDFQNSSKGGENKSLTTARALLGALYHDIANLVSFRATLKGCQMPAEKLRMGHDARLQKEKIEIARRNLQNVLRSDLNVQSVIALESDDNTDNGDHILVIKNSMEDDMYQDALEVFNSFAASRAQREVKKETRGGPHVTHRIGYQPDNSHGTLSLSQKTSSTNVLPNLHEQGRSLPAAPDSMSSFTSELQQNSPTAAKMQRANATRRAAPAAPDTFISEHIELKQAYIDEQWLPFLRKALSDKKLPPFQNKVTSWVGIKDILSQIGFTTAERNEQLARFKDGWTRYCEQRRAITGNNAPSSPAPSPASLPVSSYSLPSQGPRTPFWPSDAEIVAEVPPQGIPVGRLLQKFSDRIGRYQKRFVQTLTRVATVDENCNVFPQQQMSLSTKQYDTTPPLTTTAASPLSRTGNVQSSNQFRDIVKLKVGQCLPALNPDMPAVDETAMPLEFMTTEVNGSRGFSFRHLPQATMEQRERMDAEVGDYITKTTKVKKKNHYGQYVTFRDPDDPTGPIIMHGFWEFKDGSRPAGSEWFYNGEDVPADWDMELGAFIGRDSNNVDDGDAEEAQSSNMPQAPSRRIKLRVAGKSPDPAMPVDSAAVPSWLSWNPQDPVQMASDSSFSISHSPPNISSGQAAFHIAGTGSINPQQLLLDNQSSRPHFGNGFTGTMQGERGTKRAASSTRGGGKKKRKVTSDYDDQDDSGDYDLSRDI